MMRCGLLVCKEGLFIYKIVRILYPYPQTPFPRKGGYITGATAPRPCRGLHPLRPIFNIYKRFFDSLRPHL